VAEAIKAKQNIFVEKPLCLSGEQLNQLIYLFNQSIDDSTDQLIIMVGFNRRFAPHIVRIKKMLDTVREPKSFIMTVNAGFIPGDHWTQDPKIGGGRIIGETCHFIDLLRFLVGYKIVTADLVKMRTDLRDTVSISMTFEDGSIGSVHYFANGNKSFPKERLEVFCAGRILQLDNFRSLTGYGWTDFKKMKLLKQDKGHGAGVAAFINAVQAGGSNPIPFSEIVEVTKVSLELAEAAR
jgi:predicted dehydrogenase